MYPKDKNHFSAKIIFQKNSNKKAFRVKQTNFEKKIVGEILEDCRKIRKFFKMDDFL